MIILIDNGHGSGTPGKRSPDGLFREYSYTREIARRVVSELSDCGYDVDFLQSSTWKSAIVMLHVEGIIDYLSR